MKTKKIKRNQQTFASIIRIYLKVAVDVRIHHKDLDSINISRPVLFVSNHQHHLDPFVVMSTLPPVFLNALLPCFFMTANMYYFSPLKPFARALGCRPAKNNTQRVPYGIDDAVTLLKSGCSYFIFPEGKRTTGQTTEAKPGVYEIIRQTKPQIVIIRLNWGKKGLIKRRLRLSYSTVNYKSISSAKDILDKVYLLRLS